MLYPNLHTTKSTKWRYRSDSADFTDSKIDSFVILRNENFIIRYYAYSYESILYEKARHLLFCSFIPRRIGRKQERRSGGQLTPVLVIEASKGAEAPFFSQPLMKCRTGAPPILLHIPPILPAHLEKGVGDLAE